MNTEEKRFHAAVAAMQSVISTCDHDEAIPGNIAYWSVAMADALLAELDRTAVVKESLTPEPEADGWIAHKPGDPMPCPVKAKIRIQTENGYMSSDWNYAWTFDWRDTKEPGDNIIAWKPAENLS